MRDFRRVLQCLGLLTIVFGLLLTGACFANDLPPKAGMFLVARDGMPDPRFRESVILLVQHDGGGSGGLVINRPSRLGLGELFADQPDFAGMSGQLYYGGPVSPSSLVVLTDAVEALPEESVPVIDKELYVTGILQMNSWLSTQKKTPQYRVYTGYAGWGPGQLASEIARGDWRVLPGDVEAVFTEEVSSLWHNLRQYRVM